MESGGDPESFPFFVGGGGLGERGGFSGSGAFVQKGSVGNFHPGQLQDHGLIVEEGLETTLRDFWLVRSIGGVPARIFDNGSPEDGGSNRSVISQTDERAEGFILGEDLFQVSEGTGFRAGGWEPRGLRGSETRRKSGLDKLLK